MTLLRRPPLPIVVAVVWAAVGLQWLADAAGSGLPAWLDRAAVAAALLGAAVLIGRAVLRAARGGPATRILLVLLALSLVLCFAGLDHEVGGRDFGDEGIYRAQAERINEQGQILRPWFVYPHLLFYLDAVALWIAGLFQPAVDLLARLVYGVEGELPVAALVTRSVTALLGALLPWPVFVTARRVAGEGAAVAGAALAALSPLAVALAHLNLSDVAAGFFAALAVAQASALLDRETRRDYLLAGLSAGLAAGAKYPAGLVALAVAALWLRRRLVERRMGWGLLWAAGAALAAFLATTPSLLAFPGAAFGGGTDVLFGVRQYAAGGWTGVVRASNSLYYGGELAAGYGWPALLLGVGGLAGLGRRELGRLAWLLPFPVAHAALLLGLEMAVERNLLPLLGAAAAVLGCGLAGCWRLLGRLPLPRRARRAVGALLAAGVLAWPAWATAAEVIRLARPTTREEAAAWIERNLPPGSFLVQEAYTPGLGPEWRFPARRPRSAARIPFEELEDGTYDFLFLAGGSYNRFLRPRNLDDLALEHFAARYRQLFARYDLVREWRPGRFQGGSELRLYRLDPDPPPWTGRRAFRPEEALLRSPEMAPAEGDGAIRYGAPDQWSLFKAYLLPGRYRARLTTGAPVGRVEVRDRANRVLAEGSFEGEPLVEMEIAAREKCFLYVHLPAGARLAGVAVRGISPGSPGP